MDHYVVSDQEHGLSLLAFLSEKSKGTYSVKKIKRAIESKNCTVNGRQEFFPSRKLMAGDVVVAAFVEKAEDSFSILFQDADYVIVEKPSGCVCSNEEFRKRLGPTSHSWRLVHRLDKDTSGIVLLAKNDRAEESAKKLFSQREVQKLYLALVDGEVVQKELVIDNFLGAKGGYQGQTVYAATSEEKGKRAITHIRCLIAKKNSSLLLCSPKTGRTHQIRVHVSQIGHPILGDAQYGNKGFTCSFLPARHLLHAWKLSFVHPGTHKKVEVTAQIPADFEQALQALKMGEVKFS